MSTRPQTGKISGKACRHSPTRPSRSKRQWVRRGKSKRIIRLRLARRQTIKTILLSTIETTYGTAVTLTRGASISDDDFSELTKKVELDLK
jgi:hypothetical protein